MTSDELFLLSSISRLNSFTVSESEKQFGIDGWLANKNYRIRVDAGKLFLSETSNDLDIVFANEITRLGSASIETLALICKQTPASGAAPWGLIKLYYASFFAANATLRLFGESCTYLSSEAIVEYGKMKRVYGIVDPESNLGNSLYHVSSPMKSEVSFSKLGDSHQGLWKTYINFLKGLPTLVNASGASDQTKVSVIAILDNIQGHVEKRRDGREKPGWMSNFRNDVNYKQSYGIWYPSERGANKFQSDLKGRINTFLKASATSISVTSDLDYMVESALLVIQFFLEVVNFNIVRVAEPNANLNRLRRQLNQEKLI